jgi:hypothetical protein
MSDGHFGEVDVAADSLTTAQSSPQALINALLWAGHSRWEP